MVSLLKLFSMFLLLCMLQKAWGTQCGLSDIIVSQEKTGVTVEGKPEYEVVVSNNCGCPQSKVFLQCYGLSSVEKVDPHAIKPVDGVRCIVGDGRPIAKGAPVRFKYAWMTPQDFPVVSSHILC